MENKFKVQGNIGTWTYFEMLGNVYRTDNYLVERKDGQTWNATGSLRIVLAAREAFELSHKHHRNEMQQADRDWRDSEAHGVQ